MHILVTGGAGFVGFHLIQKLLHLDIQITAVDNINDYYSLALKHARLEQLHGHTGYSFVQLDISDRKAMSALFDNNHFDVVINLAAQAGVRYSLENPHAYADSNLIGFMNILEGCRQQEVKHLLFASSSSVYGMSTQSPFSIDDRADHPVSLYAATKRSNELMAYSYSHLYNLPITGMRFFTAYGPWGRPDMAYFKFTQAIFNEEPIKLFNNGNMRRDFTYIDDLVDCVSELIHHPPERTTPEHSHACANYRLVNIGNHNPVSLCDFVHTLEKACGKSAIKHLLPMQPGDVPATYADTSKLQETIQFTPKTSLEDGLHRFVHWYKSFYH